jgi:hypothetical protein
MILPCEVCEAARIAVRSVATKALLSDVELHGLYASTIRVSRDVNPNIQKIGVALCLALEELMYLRAKVAERGNDSKEQR